MCNWSAICCTQNYSTWRVHLLCKLFRPVHPEVGKTLQGAHWCLDKLLTAQLHVLCYVFTEASQICQSFKGTCMPSLYEILKHRHVYHTVTARVQPTTAGNEAKSIVVSMPDTGARFDLVFKNYVVVLQSSTHRVMENLDRVGVLGCDVTPSIGRH